MTKKNLIFCFSGLASLVIFFFIFQNCSKNTLSSQWVKNPSSSPISIGPSVPNSIDTVHVNTSDQTIKAVKLTGAKQIYESLNAKEIDRSNGALGASYLAKSAGGLTCTKITVVAPGAIPNYECTFSESQKNFNDLYLALIVSETPGDPRLLGAATLTKIIGGLKCMKSTVVYPNAIPNYFCDFQSVE